jgi:hypothetical protein
MRKIVRLTENDLSRIVKRVIKEQTNNNLKNLLLKSIGNYKSVCQLCSKQSNLDTNNPRARKAAHEFQQAIYGGENPLSNFGGWDNKKSSASKAGMALEKNLTSAEDICTMIKYYGDYYGGDEDFCEALSGELKFKVDSTRNLELMFITPLKNILSRI